MAENGNEWMKFRVVPCSHPLRPHFLTLSYYQVWKQQGFRLQGWWESLPLGVVSPHLPVGQKFLRFYLAMTCLKLTKTETQVCLPILHIVALSGSHICPWDNEGQQKRYVFRVYVPFLLRPLSSRQMNHANCVVEPSLNCIPPPYYISVWHFVWPYVSDIFEPPMTVSPQNKISETKIVFAKFPKTFKVYF